MTHFIDLDLTINKKTTKSQLLVFCLGRQKIILGFPWLNEHNPDINWKTGELKWRTPYPGLAQLFRKHQGKPPSPPTSQNVGMNGHGTKSNNYQGTRIRRTKLDTKSNGKQ